MSADCVARFCTGVPYSWGGCQQSGPSAFVPFPAQISHCCTAQDPNACFSALQKGGGSGGGDSVTSAVQLPVPCATLTSILQSCASASSAAFVNGNGDTKAQCLCYDGNGNPNVARWDGAEAACYALGAASVGSSFWSAVSADGTNWCASKVGAGSTTAAVSGSGGGAPTTSSSSLPGQASPTKSGAAAGQYTSLMHCMKWLSGGWVALYVLKEAL